MAGLLFLKITSSISGDYPGSSTQQGFEDQIPIISTQHQVESFQSTTARARWQSVISPFSISKEVDITTPLLFGAWRKNEHLNKVKLTYLKSDLTGQMVPFYEVELNEARVVKITQTMASPDSVEIKESETVSFTFDSMIIRHIESGHETELQNYRGV